MFAVAAKSTLVETPFETPGRHLVAQGHRAFETSNGEYEHEYLDRQYAANAIARETDTALAGGPGALGHASDRPNRRTHQGIAPGAQRRQRHALDGRPDARRHRRAAFRGRVCGPLRPPVPTMIPSPAAP